MVSAFSSPSDAIKNVHFHKSERQRERARERERERERESGEGSWMRAGQNYGTNPRGKKIPPKWPHAALGYCMAGPIFQTAGDKGRLFSEATE